MQTELTSSGRCARAVAAVARGDMQPLAVIYDELGRQIFALALSILNNSADAEDAMQDTFVRIARHAQTFDQNGNARAWIMAVARNAALDILRRRREIPVPDGSFENTAQDGDFTRVYELNAMLSTLEEDDKQIVILKVVNGMKFGEIAAVFGITPEAARKRCARALEKLKAAYGR